MRVSYFRSSYIGGLDFCEFKNFMVYNLGLHDPANAKANYGTSIHKVFEGLALLKKSIQENKDFGVIDDSVIGQHKIPIGDLFSVDMLREWSEKSLQHYMKNTGIDISNRNKIQIKSDKYNTDKIIDTVLNRDNGNFDPRRRTIIEPEREFSFLIEKDWAKYNHDGNEGYLGLKGTIDLITQLPDGGIEIIDWKTGSLNDWAKGGTKDYNSLCEDNQLMLYYYAARKLYPEAPYIILTIYFVRFDKPFTICFEDEHLVKMEKKLKTTFEYVNNIKLPKMCSYNQTSPKCLYMCNFYKNKWEGTEQNQCRYIHDQVKKNGIEYVEKKFKATGHSLDKYQSPGE